MDIKLLNFVKDSVIEQCNSEGVNLADHFETPKEFRQFIAELSIKLVVEIGISVNDAVDIVLGDGSFDEIAGDIWERLQPQA